MAYLSVCLCLALGLMAKSMLVTLPCVLLLLDWWPLRRIPRTVTLQRAIVEKLPLLALAGMAGAFTFVAQSRAGLVVPLAARPLGERLANAVTSYVTYAAKTFWPMTLSCFYPYPESFAVGAVVGATAVLVAVSALAISLVRSRPYVATGWFWYLGTLVPVIGIVGIGGQSMADHYTYLPLIGLFVVVSWGAWDLFERVPHREIVLGGAAVLAIGLCVAKTRVEAAYWRDSRSLFEHALAVTSRNFLAHGNLGLVLRQEGRSAEAMTQFSAALAVAPEYVEARNHLGLTQRDLGEPAKAVASFEEVLRRAPDFAPAHFNLGETLLTMGDDRRAIEEFSTTVRLAPDHVGAHLQLSRLLLQRGQAEEAVSHARQALALGPASPQALGYLADALAVSGNLDEAVTYYREALRMQPDDVDATYNLGNALARRGQMDEAIATYRRAITLAPDHAEAHNNLGRALMSQGRTEEAVSHYSEALRLAPSMAVAFYNRGMANQQLGKTESAADDLARARALDPNLR
jgi:tetratricopeptide (TPR) repeat protein